MRRGTLRDDMEELEGVGDEAGVALQTFALPKDCEGEKYKLSSGGRSTA